jgi:chromosome segregation ATPase
MKAAPEEPVAAATTEGEAGRAAKPAVPQSNEAIASAQAKVDDLRYREVVLNKNMARLEGSLATARQEENEDRVKTFTETIDSTKATLAATSEQLKAAEKELMDMRMAAAAAAATAPKKKAAPASTPKS